eukprot:scaffold802_cov280-Pinguiococcus_pyrenoidosus.AAC.5
MIVLERAELLGNEVLHGYCDGAELGIDNLDLRVIVAELRHDQALERVVKGIEPVDEDEVVRDVIDWLKESCEELREGNHALRGRHGGDLVRHCGNPKLAVERVEGGPEEKDGVELEEEAGSVLKADRKVEDHAEHKGHGHDVWNLHHTDGQAIRLDGVCVGCTLSVEDRALCVERRDGADRDAAVRRAHVVVVLLPVHRAEEKSHEGSHQHPRDVVLRTAEVADARSPHAHAQLQRAAGGVQAVELGLRLRSRLDERPSVQVLGQLGHVGAAEEELVKVLRTAVLPGAGSDAVQHVHRCVRAVREFGRNHVLRVLAELAKEHGAAASLQQQERIELVKDGLGRLVNGRDDGAPAHSGLLDGLHHEGSCLSIESRRGLVKEEDGRVGSNLDADCEPLCLLLRRVFHLQVAQRRQVQRVDDLLNVRVELLVAHGLGQAQTCAEVEALVHRELLDVNVRLLAVADDPAEGRAVQLVAVHVHVALDAASRLAVGDHVHERGLRCATHERW